MKHLIHRVLLLFSTFYVFLIWGMLVILTPFILDVFNLSDGAADVVKAFNYIAAGSYIVAGALYVSNASFNNLGKHT